MFSNYINLQYCYDYLIEQIPVGLLLYAHIPGAILALLFGLFLIFKKRDPASISLFFVCTLFALWCLTNISSWFSFFGSSFTMFTWSLIGFFDLLFFFFSYYFLYSFIYKKAPPIWQQTTGALLLLPTAYWTLLGANLLAFDSNICEAWENSVTNTYLFIAEGVFLLATIALTIYAYKKEKNTTVKREITLAGTGVSIFLGFFLSAAIIVSILLSYESLAEYAYNYEIYGLFGMPILLGFLGYLIVRYKAFDLRIFGVQALSLALVAGIASQFAFLESGVAQTLTAITLVITGIVSLILGRSVKREIGLRQQLETMNQQQIETMRFITHEVKGYLTDSSGAFDALLTNSFGPINDETRTMVQEALNKDQKAIGEIKEFLRISDFKTGKVAYQMAPFDIQEALSTALPMLDDNAQKKNLKIISNVAPGNYMVHGDQDQITNHVISNLIHNATNYTPAGSITISLSRKGDRILFSVQDTGVGLSEEDKAVLFTEGGRGTESRNVNPHSTGYGLFIAKKIVEAHGGRIWAESDGRDKGSTFFVELPALN